MEFNSSPFYLKLLLGMGLFLTSCRDKAPVEPSLPKGGEEGYLIVDSTWVIDAYGYDSAACREVLASGVPSAGVIPAASVAVVKVNSTACYKVQVRVEDSALKWVRSFEHQFAILNRQEGDKDRGVEGYITWDGTDNLGQRVPLARYLWRLDFDFGKGRHRRVRADIRLD